MTHPSNLLFLGGRCLESVQCLSLLSGERAAVTSSISTTGAQERVPLGKPGHKRGWHATWRPPAPQIVRRGHGTFQGGCLPPRHPPVLPPHSARPALGSL